MISSETSVAPVDYHLTHLYVVRGAEVQIEPVPGGPCYGRSVRVKGRGIVILNGSLLLQGGIKIISAVLHVYGIGKVFQGPSQPGVSRPVSVGLHKGNILGEDAVCPINIYGLDHIIVRGADVELIIIAGGPEFR